MGRSYDYETENDEGYKKQVLKQLQDATLNYEGASTPAGKIESIREIIEIIKKISENALCEDLEEERSYQKRIQQLEEEIEKLEKEESCVKDEGREQE